MTQLEEDVKFAVKANLKRGFEYVGGHLTITDQSLHFKPHKMNIQKEELFMHISDVKSAEKAKILGLSPNGVLVHLKDESYYKFTIGMPKSKVRDEIIHYLNEQD